MSKSVIKVGSISLPLYKHTEGWRFAFKDQNGQWKYVTRRDKKEAATLAREKARALSNEKAEILGGLTDNELSLLSRIRELGFSHSDLDEWETRCSIPKIRLDSAIREFLALKEANKGASGKNLSSLTKTLNSFLKHLPDAQLQEINAKAIQNWIGTFSGVSARRKYNLRAGIVTLFRWARKNNYLPDSITEAEKVEVPITTRRVPTTYSPQELKILLTECRRIAPEYVPWMVLCSFSGLRSEEVCPDEDNPKAALLWNDFNWERKVIIVRPETAKMGFRRVIPISPVVEAWIKPLAKHEGLVGPKIPCYRIKIGRDSLTAIFAAKIGGWKVNALRHSFISYRAAQVGLASTAMEAGNSEAEAKRSYNDAKSAQDAEDWFNVFP